MSLSVILQEFFRLIKEKWYFILVGTLLLGGLAFFYGQGFSGGEGTTAEEQSAGRTLLQERFKNKPATFEFTAIYPDGTYFNNGDLVDAYFSSLDGIKLAKEATGIDLSDWYQAERLFFNVAKKDLRGGFFDDRDRSSSIHKVYVNMGKNSEENLTLAKFYYKTIMDHKLPMMDGTTIYSISEPKIEAHDLDASGHPYNLPDDLRADETLVSSKVVTVAGAIVGFVLSFGLLFLYYTFKDTIRYAFQYSWNLEDVFLSFHRKKKEDRERLHQILEVRPKRLLLAEEGSGFEGAVSDLMQYPPEAKEVEVISILIQTGKTHRSWYNLQKELAKRYDCPIEIVHVIG